MRQLSAKELGLVAGGQSGSGDLHQEVFDFRFPNRMPIGPMPDGTTLDESSLNG
jgi:hypothetical protein